MYVIDAARDLAKRVGPVLPVKGKIPLWQGWPERATIDITECQEWAEATGIGLLTGSRTKHFVLDVDRKIGLSILLKWQSEYGDLPITWTQRTGGGGAQYFYHEPGFMIRNSAGKLGPGIDVRGEGGFVVAPPSIHPSGNEYRWAEGRSPWEVKLAPAPAWLIEKLRPKSAIMQLTPMISRLPEPEDVMRRAKAYLAKIPGAVSGNDGHGQTWKATLAVVRGFALGLEPGYDLLLREYNPRCDPSWSESELRHKVLDAVRKAYVPWGYLVIRSFEVSQPGLPFLDQETRSSEVGSTGLQLPVTSNRIVERDPGCDLPRFTDPDLDLDLVTNNRIIDLPRPTEQEMPEQERFP